MTEPKALSPKNKQRDSNTMAALPRCQGKSDKGMLMWTVLGCSVLVFLIYTKSGSFSKIIMNAANNNDVIESIEIQTGQDPTHSVIWLHGLGADGHDFEPIVPQLKLSSNSSVRFVLPHAPIRKITVNNGMEMRGWYDVAEVPLDPAGKQQQDRKGLEQSDQIVRDLIKQENKHGVTSENIFLVGFSQGGVVALFTGLRFQNELAGIIALSAYLPVAETTESERSTENSATPIFMGHGLEDPIIPHGVGKHSEELLTDLGYSVEFHSYAIPHSVHSNEVDHIAAFINRIISP